MTRVCSVPSVIVHSQAHKCSLEESIECLPVSTLSVKNNDGTEPPLSWLLSLWNLVESAYQKFINYSSIPFDLLAALFLRHRSLSSVPEEATASTKLQETRIALHPELEILAVAPITGSCVLFYDTSNTRHLWCCRLKRCSLDVPQGLKSASTSNNTITCLQFSTANQLAIGLSDGSIVLLETELSQLLKRTTRRQSRQKSTVEHIRLFPCDDSNLYSKAVGSVTNILFSPTETDTDNNTWLAIGTKHSGIWIWNNHSNQAVRALESRGIDPGCLHWVSLKDIDSPDDRYSTPTGQQNHLTASTLQKYHNSFGLDEDIAALDSYFAPSLRSSLVESFSNDTPHLSHFRAALSSIQQSVPVEPEKKVSSYDGESLLIFGSQDGSVRIQKLWHSYRSMKLETSHAFVPACVARLWPLSHTNHSWREAISKTIVARDFFPTNAIHHLWLGASNITKETISVELGMSLRNGSTSTQTFNVSLPLKTPPAGFLENVPLAVASMYKALMNLILIPSGHQWLGIQSFRAGVLNYVQQGVNQQFAGLPRSRGSIGAISNLGSSPQFLLAIESDTDCNDCILSYQGNISNLTTPVATIISPFLTEKPVPSKEPHSWAEDLLGEFGIHPRRTGHSRLASQRKDSAAGTTQDQSIEYGQVGWGVSSSGSPVGAFAYWPASGTEDEIGIGLFELLA